MSTVLDHHQDPNYEPSQTEIVEYGKWLGMELPADEPLLWVAREGLKAPLPEHWKACKSEKGELYYFNFKTGQSIWDHPLDEHYKQLFKKEKAKFKEGSAASETNNTAAPAEKSKLPPSGKKAPAVAVSALSSGPLSTATAGTTPTVADDDASSTTSADSTKRGGKLAALKTLKVRKEVPEELRIDTGSTPTSIGSSTSKSAVLTPQSTNHATQSILVPAVKITAGKGFASTPQQQIPVETPDEVPTSIASKFSPISTIDTPSNVVEPSAVKKAPLAAVAHQSSSSSSLPTSEQIEEERKAQVESIQRQHNESLEELRRQKQNELKQFQSQETQRMEKEKDEFTNNLESAMKKTKAQLRQRHEQQVQSLQKELDAKLAETQRRLDEEYQSAKKKSNETHNQRMEQMKLSLREVPTALASDLEPLVEEMVRKISSLQSTFAAQVKSGMDNVTHQLHQQAQNQRDAEVRRLKEEEQNATVHIREVQTECNSKVAMMKLECESKLQELKLKLAEEKSALLDAHRIEMASLSAELKAHQRQTLLSDAMPTAQHRSPIVKKNDSPHKLSHRHNDDPLSTGTSSDGDDHVLDSLPPPPLPQHSNVVVEAKGNLHPAPLSSSAFLSGSPSVQPTSVGSVPSAADLRTLMTDVLRELFQGSPFIVPSPGSQQASKASSPMAQPVAARDMEVPDPNVPVELLKPSQYQPSALNQSQVIPDSYKEQQSLVEDERRRLEEGKLFVASQRASLEERRAQLKVARRNWKADVMAAKALGVQSNSKKGQLLHKVHRVLDKQAAGLEHDDSLLRDSEQWLKTKEQRLLRLESQLAEQHEKSRHGPLDISTCSIDTTALFTGYFKPTTTANGDAVHRTISPAGRPVDAVAPQPTAASRPDHSEERIGPSLSKALERIERRIDRVATMVSERPPARSEPPALSVSSRPRTAPAPQQQSTNAAVTMGSSTRDRVTTAAATLSASSRGRAADVVPAMSASARGGGKDPLSSSTRNRGELKDDAPPERAKSNKRSSRSTSRHRHVDFAAPTDIFADPWSEAIAA